MEAAVAFGIGNQTSTILVVLAAFGTEFILGLGEIVIVDKIMTCIVWRIAQVGTMDTTAWGGIRETYG